MKPKGCRGSRHGGTDFIGGADKKGLIVRGDLPPSAHFPPRASLPGQSTALAGAGPALDRGLIVAGAPRVTSDWDVSHSLAGGPSAAPASRLAPVSGNSRCAVCFD